MKKLTTILFFSALFGTLAAGGQIKKQLNVDSAGSTSLKTVTKTTVNPTNKNTITTEPISKDTLGGKSSLSQDSPIAKNSAIVTKENMINVTSSNGKRTTEVKSPRPYKAAVGVKFLWGVSATGKLFLKDEHAIEAIVRYRSYRKFTKEFTISALYEYQKPIAELPGLYWLVGAGPYFGTVSFKDSFLPQEFQASANTYFGISGIGGLEYKLEKLPLAISADWMPAINISGGGGFSANNGGFGIKYTF
jgi:hypothetical protein